MNTDNKFVLESTRRATIKLSENGVPLTTDLVDLKIVTNKLIQSRCTEYNREADDDTEENIASNEL